MIKQTIKNRLRSWLLTEDERELVDRVSQIENEANKLSSEWSELHRALQDADVIEDGAVIENADILVLTGREHVVHGGEFGGGLYINGSHQLVQDNQIGALDNQ